MVLLIGLWRGSVDLGGKWGADTVVGGIAIDPPVGNTPSVGPGLSLTGVFKPSEWAGSKTLKVWWLSHMKNYGYCNIFCSIRSPFYCLSLPCREKRLFICRTDSFRILWHFSKAFFSKFDKHIWRCTVIKIRSPSLSLSDRHPWKIIKNREISHDSTRPTSAGFLCRVRFGYAAWSGLTRWHVTMLSFEKTSHRDDIFYSIHSFIVHAASTYWLWEKIKIMQNEMSLKLLLQ